MRPVVLVNHWHDDNRGDSAITHSTLALMEQAWPDRPLILYTLHPRGADQQRATRHVREAFPQVAVRCAPTPSAGLGASSGTTIWWFARMCWLAARLGAGRPPRELAQLREAHAVCLLGGSNLFVQGRHRYMGLARLLQLVAPALVAQRSGVPTYALGHTIGPLRGRSSAWLARSVLSRARLVTVREERSASLLAELGVPAARYRVAPDLAFGLAPSTAGSGEALRRAGLEGVRFLALSMRQHPYSGDAATERVAREMVEFARGAVRSGSVERVAVFAQALGPTAIEDDRGVSRRMAADIGPEAVFVEEDLGPRELAGCYEAAHVVVAVRLHAAILSLAAGVPTVAIGYFTAKTEGVFRLLGMPEMCCEFADVDAGFLSERLHMLLDNGYAGHVRAAVEQARGQVLALGPELS